MKTSAKENGFTLLELMITCAVTVVALAGLFKTYVNCFDVNETGRNSNIALNAAAQVLEQIRSTPFLSIYTNYNGHTFPVPGLSSNTSLGYVVVDNSNLNLLKIDVGVCWKQKSSRIIGECVANGSGNLTFSDTNGNGRLDSSVQLTTLMAQR